MLPRLALPAAAVAASAFVVLVPLEPAAAGASPPHLDRAASMAAALRGQTLAGGRFDAAGKPLNDYASDHFMLWHEDGAAWSENRTLCNQFVAGCLKKAYGWSDTKFKAKFGATWPTAEKFYADIRDGAGFARVTALAAVAPGDVAAIWYRDDPASGYPNPTGHALVVASVGPTYAWTFPESGVTVSFRDLEVLDSSKSPHSADSRAFAAGELGSGSAATDWAGAGRGWMRVYVDGAGSYLGYTWSLTGDRTKPPGTPPTWSYYSTSYKPESLRHFIVGRVTVP